MWSFTSFNGLGPGTQGERRPGGTGDFGAPSQRKRRIPLSQAAEVRTGQMGQN